MAGLLGSSRGGGDVDRTPSVRILLVGNSGSGKTCIAHLITNRSPAKAVRQTVGCSTSVAMVESAEVSGLGDARHQRPVIVELWDIGAHERYKTLRSSFYANISGVIIVTDSTSSRSQASVRKWAAEVAGKGRFVAAMPPEQAAANPASLPVPCLVINNKADLRGAGMMHSGRLNGWLRTFLVWLEAHFQQFKFRRKLKALMRPASSGAFPDDRLAATVVSASALQGIIDEAALDCFFAECITRRLSFGSVGAVSTKFIRRPASGGGGGVGGGGLDLASARKPLTHVSPYSAERPPTPAYAPYHCPTQNGGPHSQSSWGGFDTTSFHSTRSSTSDQGWSCNHSQSKMDDSDDLV